MSKEIINLEPSVIWKHFYALTQIPRPSKKEGKIIEYMKKFGEDLNLETMVDEVGNVIIRKPATPGMEDRKTVILQGHLDMVPQKNSDTKHDFESDPIDAYVDGEWVTAHGTTLGADNGIGVSAAMAVLESKSLKHGPVEALFTIDEETGMTGAFGLKPGVLEGEILINMDSEDEGELYIGCAGGTNANVRFEIGREKAPGSGHAAYKINLTGLKGGHSGIDIHLGKGNANKLMNRVLWTVYRELNVLVSSVNGGNLRNAIPREAFATVVVPESKVSQFEKSVGEMEKILKNEYSTVEPNLSLSIEKTELPATVLDSISHYRLLNAVYACPNGVIRMSTDMEGLVETSTNLAICNTGEHEAEVSCLMRSSVDSARDDLKNMFRSVFEPAGADVSFDGEYPGWKPNPDSAILKEMKEIYHHKFDKVPEIKAIHAGLECGLLGGHYPGLDMISFGPTIRFPHSPDEKVNIGTVRKFWDFLVETLEHVPVK